MSKNFTLEYWVEDDWYVGRIQEVPGVFSQGQTIEELNENIRDAYRMVMEESQLPGHPQSRTMDIEVSV
ncbi:MAG: type II toxin-antitoxin system HicB family antitoxin [Deltaproteobacteria bacterium]|nr:type II toxin-antitoxin system HicB family antitoxin [Deltaproteobacteria bacterium]